MLSIWQNLALNIDPVAFSLFGFPVRWYGLMYLVGFGTVYLLAKKWLKTNKNFTSDEFEEIILLSIVSVIVGGRIGYILFYDFSYFVENPLQIFIPYNFETKEYTGIAGMSFHGGLFLLLLSNILYCKFKKKQFEQLVKLILPAVPLGYMFGRIGNFLNNELWGKKTSSFLGMYHDGTLKHPSQLYEAFFEGFVLFWIIYFLKSSKFFKDKLLSVFLIGYSLFRFAIEYVREPDVHLGYIIWGLSMGQLLSIATIILAIYFWWAR